ncbi:MAG: PAS domain-containing protein [Alteraurantiacibacter sp.]
MQDTPEQPVSGQQAVSAAEFVRNFARLREVALQHPVMISHHGRVSHVLTSIEDFCRAQAAPCAGTPGDESPTALFDLADWLDDAVLACNHNERIVYANRVAAALFRVRVPHDGGTSLRLALPAFYDSLLEVNFRHTLNSREPTTADLPSPFTPGNWLNFRCVPLRDCTVMAIRDITDEVQHLRLADVKKAMFDALALNGTIGCARLNVRGAMERVDDTFCNWVGVAQDKLLGVPLLNLIDRSDRARFHEGMERVLSGTGSLRTVVRLLPNRSGVLAVDCAMVQLQGTYGAEGAVTVFTRDGGPVEVQASGSQ